VVAETLEEDSTPPPPRSVSCSTFEPRPTSRKNR
jgi:hypothetical protein